MCWRCGSTCSGRSDFLKAPPSGACCNVKGMLEGQPAPPVGRGRVLKANSPGSWGGGCPGSCLACMLPWQAGQHPENKAKQQSHGCLPPTSVCRQAQPFHLYQQTGGLVHDRGLCACNPCLGLGVEATCCCPKSTLHDQHSLLQVAECQERYAAGLHITAPQLAKPLMVC